MIEIKSFNELVERLLDSEFNFRIENDKLIIKSSPYREKNSSLLGFHYWGQVEDHVFDLGSNNVNIEDVIYDSFNVYKGFVKNYLENKFADICKKI